MADPAFEWSNRVIFVVKNMYGLAGFMETLNFFAIMGHRPIECYWKIHGDLALTTGTFAHWLLALQCEFRISVNPAKPIFLDLDNNGYLDIHDFECLALKYTILELKGQYNKDAHEKNKKVMISLWLEIAELADFNKDGQVTTEEFQTAVQNVCVGKTFEQFPQSLKHAINCKFMGADINGDGLIGVDEFRLDCVSRAAFDSIEEIDNCYQKILSDDDRKRDGINKARYQELFAEFIGSPKPDVPGAYLFGPLPLLK